MEREQRQEKEVTKIRTAVDHKQDKQEKEKKVFAQDTRKQKVPTERGFSLLLAAAVLAHTMINNTGTKLRGKKATGKE